MRVVLGGPITLVPAANPYGGCDDCQRHTCEQQRDRIVEHDRLFSGRLSIPMTRLLAILALAGCSEVGAPLRQDEVFKAIGAGNTCIEAGNSDNACTHLCIDVYQSDDERLEQICRTAVGASIKATAE
jgi:hypothetical protein